VSCSLDQNDAPNYHTRRCPTDVTPKWIAVEEDIAEVKKERAAVWSRGKDKFDTCDCGCQFGFAERDEFVFCPMCGGKINRAKPKKEIK